MKSGDVTMGIEERDLDAVILDLAVPWLVIPHAYEALKPSGVLVSFSPTIDQVVRATEALRDAGFVFIETIECLMRTMQVERGKTRPNTMMTGHTGYITHARKIIKPATEQPAAAERSRSRKRSFRRPRNSDRRVGRRFCLSLLYFLLFLLLFFHYPASACLAGILLV